MQCDILPLISTAETKINPSNCMRIILRDLAFSMLILLSLFFIISSMNYFVQAFSKLHIKI